MVGGELFIFCFVFCSRFFNHSPFSAIFITSPLQSTSEGLLYSLFGFVFTWSNIVLDLNIMLAIFKKPMFPRWLLYGCFFAIQIVGLILSIIVYDTKATSHLFGLHCTPIDLLTYRKVLIIPVIVGVIINLITASTNNTIILSLYLQPLISPYVAVLSAGNSGSDANKSKCNSDSNSFGVVEVFDTSSSASVARSISPPENSDTNAQWARGMVKISWRPALLSLLVCISFLAFLCWW